MALTANQVLAIIDDLELALATGAANVSIDGRTIAYTSGAQIQSALRYFRNKLAVINGTTVPRPMFRKINMGGGYEGTSGGEPTP